MAFRRSIQTACTVSIITLSMSFAFGEAPRPPRTYHLEQLKWHVWLNPTTSSLSGYVVNVIKPFAPHLTRARFDCGPMTIGKISVNGVDTSFKHIKDALFVDIPKFAQAGQVLRIAISYWNKPTAGAYFVKAMNAYPAHTPVIYTQGEAEDTRFWLPTYDFPDDKALSESWITVPKGWKVLGNGKLVGVSSGLNNVTYHWKMNHPMATYLNSFVAGPYDVGQEYWNKLSVQYWAPQGLLRWGKAGFGGTGKIIRFYSHLTNYMYPWPKFAQAAVPDFMFGGMENASAVTQTIGALHPPRDQQTEDSTGLVAHELAHQWFGDTITCKDWSHAWLNEGFATFLPIFWDRQREGQDAFDLGRFQIFQQALLGAQFSHEPVVWTGYKIPMDNFGLNIYPGGASRLFMLMNKLGEKKFWKAIHYYLVKNQFTSIGTPTFFKSISQASGVNLTPFMKQWFYTVGAPHVDAKMDGSNLILTQTKPDFHFPLEIWALTDSGWTKKTVQITNEVTTVPMGDLASDPILLDPRKILLASFKSHWHLGLDTWLKVFGQAPISTRLEMIETGKPEMSVGMGGFGRRFRQLPSGVKRVGSTNPLDQIPNDTLVKLTQDEPNLDLKTRLIGHLTMEDEPELMAYSADNNARVRRAAVQTLGSIYGNKLPDNVLSRLKDMMNDDSNDDVKNSAFSVVLNSTQDNSLAERAWGTDSYREYWRTTALNFFADHHPNKARQMALDAINLPMSLPVRETAIRVLGRLKDAPGQTAVLDTLIKVAGEGEYGLDSATCSALGSYGSPKAIPVLKQLSHSDLFFIYRAANFALQTLKASK